MKQLKNLTAVLTIFALSSIISCGEYSPTDAEVAVKMAAAPLRVEAMNREFNEAFLGVAGLLFVPDANGSRTDGGTAKHGDHGSGNHGEKPKGEKPPKDKNHDGENGGGDENGNDGADGDGDPEDNSGTTNNGTNTGSNNNNGTPASSPSTNNSGTTNTGSTPGTGTTNPGSTTSPAAQPQGPQNHNIDLRGQFIVDLLNGSSTPDFGVAQVLPGTYDKVNLSLAPILRGGKSIFISMTLTSDNLRDPIIIEFSLKGKLEIQIQNESGFPLRGGNLKQFLVLLDLNRLMDGIDLSQVATDDAGIIEVNEESNAALASQIKNKLSQVLRGGEDADGDGVIDN
jgi:hypothetical protein